ncbi:hypothetical protein [Flavobacterium laiguense]|uniref:Uncharacterized protein n=1 Tax=Flavobacterium laiguense TaxID=2169409 RepID=A0A2U1K1Z1_9FLAO|nr:hypothetical protein [Flavobacterium laiguense]PWA10988.1 hypothetical protein DB891_03915 [Flavobacterium laiguense]
MIVTITSDAPNIVFGDSQRKIEVTIDLKKDGIDGKSAYEIAVDNGYNGTLEEFTINLVDQDIDFNAYYILSKN